MLSTTSNEGNKRAPSHSPALKSHKKPRRATPSHSEPLKATVEPLLEKKRATIPGSSLARAWTAHVSEAKEMHIRDRYRWHDSYALAVRKATTSVLGGGAGIARQNAPFELDKAVKVAGGAPFGRMPFLVVCVSFIMREIEATFAATRYDRQRDAVCLAAPPCFKETSQRRASCEHLSIPCSGGAARPSPCSVRPPFVGRSTALPCEHGTRGGQGCGRPATHQHGQGLRWDDTLE